MKTYETERIFLRKIQIEDIDDSFMEWFADEELMKYYTNSRKKITKEDIVISIEDGEKNSNCFTYGIFFKEKLYLIIDYLSGGDLRYRLFAQKVFLE